MKRSDFTLERGQSRSRNALPLQRLDMPVDHHVSLKNYTSGRTTRIPKDLGPAQSLQGFDPTYRNIIDYIVRITYRIWETNDREVEYIGECYSLDSQVFDDYGLQLGNQKIIVDTHHTTSAFPDIILDAEEVIWAGNDQIGFHTSHLTRISGTNTGSSRYGNATGKTVNFLVIANCVALQNDIFLEHVLYNTSAMLQQLGIDPWEESARLVKNPPAGWPRSQKNWDQLRSATSPAIPISQAEPITGFDPDTFTREIHDNIWNGNQSAIINSYAENLLFEGATERIFSGRTAYRQYVNELRSVFPDLQLQVDEVYWMGNELDGWLISTRWSAEGTHLGNGIYRSPSGRTCQMWGITQWQVLNGIVQKEWQLFNELDLMMQILAD
ncbi:MAG TPA: hypothetical protein DGB85_02075 [Deltaproteobacteria bacterium]|nr:hypothetical protein [Deltaproteobacteria bacterium]